MKSSLTLAIALLFFSCKSEKTEHLHSKLINAVFESQIHEKDAILYLTQANPKVEGKSVYREEVFSIKGSVSGDQLKLFEIDKEDNQRGFFSLKILSDTLQRPALRGVWKTWEEAEKADTLNFFLLDMGKSYSKLYLKATIVLRERLEQLLKRKKQNQLLLLKQKKNSSTHYLIKIPPRKLNFKMHKKPKLAELFQDHPKTHFQEEKRKNEIKKMTHLKGKKTNENFVKSSYPRSFGHRISDSNSSPASSTIFLNTPKEKKNQRRTLYV